MRERALGESAEYDEGEDVQTWTYDPSVWAEAGVIDRVSLYLVRDHTDERVAQAAEQLRRQTVRGLVVTIRRSNELSPHCGAGQTSTQGADFSSDRSPGARR